MSLWGSPDNSPQREYFFRWATLDMQPLRLFFLHLDRRVIPAWVHRKSTKRFLLLCHKTKGSSCISGAEMFLELEGSQVTSAYSSVGPTSVLYAAKFADHMSWHVSETVLDTTALSLRGYSI